MDKLTHIPIPLHQAALDLRRLGWEIEYMDLDQVSPRLDIRLRRRDGRLVDFRVDHIGRATVSRYHRTIRLGRSPNHWGPQSPQIDDQFLGRESLADWREGLTFLVDYVSQNAQPKLPGPQATPLLEALRDL